MRANLDAFFRHDERAVHQGKIANETRSFFAHGERASGVTGNVIANSNRSRRFGAEVAKNLRSLAIKSFAKDHVRRNGLRPPIAFYAPLTIDVTHWGEKDNCRPRTTPHKRRASSEDPRPCL